MGSGRDNYSRLLADVLRDADEQKQASKQKALANEILREKPGSEKLKNILWIRANVKKILAMRRIIESLELK